MTNIQKFREFAIIKKFCSKVQSEQELIFKKSGKTWKSQGAFLKIFTAQGKFRENSGKIFYDYKKMFCFICFTQ